MQRTLFGEDHEAFRGLARDFIEKEVARLWDTDVHHICKGRERVKRTVAIGT